MELRPRYIHAKCAVRNTIVEQWFIKSLQVTLFPVNGVPGPFPKNRDVPKGEFAPDNCKFCIMAVAEQYGWFAEQFFLLIAMWFSLFKVKP